MRALFTLSLLPLCWALVLMPAGAQTPTAPTVTVQPAAPAAASAPTDKRIEHIHLEDKGNRIDELRYGGETQSITVKPLNSALPAYEVVPANGARNRPIGERDSAAGSTGQRVWKVLGF